MKKTVWIVDDDPDVRDVLHTMFKILGYDPLEFGDARIPAQTLMAGDAPDLLVVDINIPVVNGLELLGYIRRRPRWVHLPVMILSSESEEERVEEVMRMGADGYVFKPVTIDELDMAIRTAVQRRRAVAAR